MFGLNLPFLKISIAGNVALAAALGFVMLRADTLSAERETAEVAVQIVAERLAVSNSSIEELSNELARLNNETAIRADEYEQAQIEAAEAAGRLKEQAIASDARIERLNRLAREAGIGDCVAPESLIRDLEGIGR